MEKKEKATQIAKSLNNKLEASIMNVPILEGFNKIKSTTADNIIFAAISDKHYIEQLIVGDNMKESDSLDSKIEETITMTKAYINQTNMLQAQPSFVFLKEFNGTFKFKIYVQDYMTDGSNSRAIRQLNAYFIETKYNKFYQLSLSTGPIAIPSKVYQPGKIDLENDLMTADLVEMMDTIIANIKYI